jgi:hypothetical protein
MKHKYYTTTDLAITGLVSFVAGAVLALIYLASILLGG